MWANTLSSVHRWSLRGHASVGFWVYRALYNYFGVVSCGRSGPSPDAKELLSRLIQIPISLGESSQRQLPLALVFECSPADCGMVSLYIYIYIYI